MKKIKIFLFKNLSYFAHFVSHFGLSKKTPGVMAVYGFLNKLFWPYDNIIEVQGSKMNINIADESLSLRDTFQSYASNLIHEKETTDLFKKNMKSGDVFVDLGANIGYFSLLASKIVGKTGKVFSFEPESKNFSYLTKNLEINNYTQAKAFQKAVSDKNGKTKLFVCDYDTGHHTINQNEGIEAYSRGRDTKEKSIEIDMVTLDSFLADKTDHVDVIKMDVEGAEYLALTGMDKILRNNRNIKLFVEFFPLLIEKMGNSPRDFIEKLLNDYQFSIYVVPEDYAAGEGEIKKMNSVSEVMDYRKNEEDHINLFLKRE